MLFLRFQRLAFKSPTTLSRVALSRASAPMFTGLEVKRTFLTSATAAEPAAKPKTRSTKKSTAIAGEANKKPAVKKAATKTPAKGTAKPKLNLKEYPIPKRPQTSYFLFYAREMKTLSAPLSSVADVHSFAKTVASRWHALSDAEKKPYVDEARALYEEYLTRKEEYLQNTPKEVLVALNKKRAKKGLKRLAGSHGKKALTGYMLFMKDFAPEFRKTYTGENREIGRAGATAAGEKWRSMSDAEKQPYIDAYKREKEALAA